MNPPHPPTSAPNAIASEDCALLRTDKLSVSFGRTQALRNVTLNVIEHQVTAIIGPSGCGKTSLLQAINRLVDDHPDLSISGRILFRGEDIYAPLMDPSRLRARIGMVFDRPHVFPMSILQNALWGRRLRVGPQSGESDAEPWLRRVGLWDRLRDRLRRSALELNADERQRLCIARALAVEPELLLMDEPCSTLDPVSTGRIEEIIRSISTTCTVILVTHSMQQAARVADRTAFLFLGELIEEGETGRLFTNPQKPQTQAYISGRFG